jgi:hypothetical protein
LASTPLFFFNEEEEKLGPTEIPFGFSKGPFECLSALMAAGGGDYEGGRARDDAEGIVCGEIRKGVE